MRTNTRLSVVIHHRIQMCLFGATVFSLRAFSAIRAASAIYFVTAFVAGSSFEYSSKGNANSGAAGVHNPALHAFTLLNSIIWDNQLDGLPEEKRRAGFDKNTAAAYIFDKAFVFLIAMVENHRLWEEFARILPRIWIVFSVAGVLMLVCGIHFSLRDARNFMALFCFAPCFHACQTGQFGSSHPQGWLGSVANPSKRL